MKSALEVLSRHAGAFPQLSALSFLQVSDEPMAEHAAEAHLEAFMQGSGYEEQPPTIDRAGQKFLQTEDAKPAAIPNGWTSGDLKAVKKALHSGYVFTQAKSGEGYYPSYESQSGAIVGILKQMKEQMEADLKEAQMKEQTASAAFSELRAAKTSAIEAGEKMEEKEA